MLRSVFSGLLGWEVIPTSTAPSIPLNEYVIPPDSIDNHSVIGIDQNEDMPSDKSLSEILDAASINNGDSLENSRHDDDDTVNTNFNCNDDDINFENEPELNKTQNDDDDGGNAEIFDCDTEFDNYGDLEHYVTSYTRKMNFDVVNSHHYYESESAAVNTVEAGGKMPK
jgi:hypothetical protein